MMTEKRDAYVQKLKAKLDEWNAEIDMLAAKADQAEAEAKIGYDRRLEDLCAKRTELEEKIAELQQSSEGAWEDLKQGLENSWDILKASFSRAKSGFERGYREGREE
jgi:predicted nuclease with TOPRIM domain